MCGGDVALIGGLCGVGKRGKLDGIGGVRLV